MFSYDLVMGHRWLLGDDRLLARCGHHRDAERIPLVEATRLLMNRCSGLLFAAERLERDEFTAADADFVRRNIAKAELALGDAILVTRREYHWSVRERHRRLASLAAHNAMPWLADVQQRHATGTASSCTPNAARIPARRSPRITDRSPHSRATSGSGSNNTASARRSRRHASMP
jgi:hypothetical protein